MDIHTCPSYPSKSFVVAFQRIAPTEGVEVLPSSTAPATVNFWFVVAVPIPTLPVPVTCRSKPAFAMAVVPVKVPPRVILGAGPPLDVSPLLAVTLVTPPVIVVGSHLPVMLFHANA